MSPLLQAGDTRRNSYRPPSRATLEWDASASLCAGGLPPSKGGGARTTQCGPRHANAAPLAAALLGRRVAQAEKAASSRRTPKWWLLKAAMMLIVGALTLPAAAREYLVFFGTYTGAKSKGIYLARFDERSGKLSAPELAVETKSPSFLELHPKGRVLYAVGEGSSVGERKEGAVTAFAIDPATGRLTALNTQPSGGGGPCHLAVDSKAQHVFTANYGSGSVAALPVLADGSLGAPVSIQQHAGSSVHPQRQTGPHAHCVNLSPDERFLLAADLGLDQVKVYRIGQGSAALGENDPPFARLAPGAGPRHLEFSHDGKFVFVLNELSSSVTVFAWDAKRGTLNETQTTSTLPAGFTGNNSCAEIAVHPSGRFVYASNRGHDSVAVFAVNRKSGELTLVEHEPTQGRTPRHFALAPGGRWLLAENQGSDSVLVFRVEEKTGALAATGQSVEVPSPVCAVFWPAGK